MKNFGCLIPGVAAQQSECFLALQSLILSLPTPDEIGIADSGPRNEVLDLSLAKNTCTLMVPNPIVTRDPEKRSLIPVTHVTDCLQTFRDQLRHYSWCLKRPKGCVAIFENTRINFLSCIVPFCTILYIFPLDWVTTYGIWIGNWI
jgi:hypothetical protein